MAGKPSKRSANALPLNPPRKVNEPNSSDAPKSSIRSYCTCEAQRRILIECLPLIQETLSLYWVTLESMGPMESCPMLVKPVPVLKSNPGKAPVVPARDRSSPVKPR